MQFNKSWNTKVPNYKVQDYNFAGVCNHTKQYIILSVKGLGHARCPSQRLKLSLNAKNRMTRKLHFIHFHSSQVKTGGNKVI